MEMAAWHEYMASEVMGSGGAGLVLVEGAWQRLHAAPALDEGQVHVWRVHIPAALSFLSRFEEVLVDDELTRAQRYLRDQDRHRFIVGRGGVYDHAWRWRCACAG